MSVTNHIPDDILMLVLERKRMEAISELRMQAGVDLIAASRLVELAEDELGMTEIVDCARCDGTGKARVYRKEYQKP